jgi:flagellar motor switch protein FliM
MTTSSGPEEKMTAAKGSVQPKRHSIHSCNFRYAGRLSNENARELTSLHEKFALNVSNSLEVYLGASLRLKMLSLEQLALQDYISGTAPNTYLLPCALNVMESNFLIEMDIRLIFPIIDLLLGGTGDTASDETRELTEIDEEIMQSVTAIIVNEVDRSWRALNLSLTPGHCIKPAMIPQIFPAKEKLVLLVFEMSVGGTTGPFKIVLPTSFVGFLLRHLKAAQSKKISSRHLPTPGLRERILDCEFMVAADITQMRVLVKDLINLKPGMILKMKAPVKNPGRLTVEGVEIFEALPVRNGRLKAAQLSSRSQEPVATKE